MVSALLLTVSFQIYPMSSSTYVYAMILSFYVVQI
jgi:hypothetical protein